MSERSEGGGRKRERADLEHFLLRRVFLAREQVRDGTLDERERRAELVRDVAEEGRLCPVELGELEAII